MSVVVCVVVDVLLWCSAVVCVVGVDVCITHLKGVTSVSLAMQKIKILFFARMFLRFLKKYGCFSRMIKKQFFLLEKTPKKSLKLAVFPMFI